MTHADLPLLADLEAIAASLGEIPQRHRLRNTIKRVRTAQSCITDLTLASHNCEAVAQLASANLVMTPLHKVGAQHALIANAVLLYARATATAGKLGERGSVSIRDRLPPELRHDHDSLADVRDRVLAHVYTHEQVAETVWHQEKVLMIHDEGAWYPFATTRRTQVDIPTLERLRHLVPEALSLVRDTYQRRLAEVVELLKEIDITTAIILNHIADPVDFYGSVEEAKKALGSFKNQQQACGIIDG